ncbi:hypothetical protein [Desulfatirhabdium butyrativorans]|nr:hypothetical protein [Desulfatirhabdium butyrativorans]
MATVVLERAFHLNREFGEPDRLLERIARSIPFDIELFRQKYIA